MKGFRFSAEAAWLLLVAFLLGMVMLLTAGIYDGPLAELTLVLVLVAVAITVWRFGLLAFRSQAADQTLRHPRPWLWLLFSALAACVLAGSLDARLLIDAQGPIALVHVAQAGCGVLLLTYAPELATQVPVPRARRNLRFAVFVGLVILGGMATVRASPHPHIDVWSIHTTGAQAILRGANPYSTVSVPDTGPGSEPLSFVYPPPVLLACVLGLSLAGDVRFAWLAALLTTAITLRVIILKRSENPARMAPSLVEDAPSLMICLTPKFYFFLEQSWNDALPIAFLSLAVLAHLRQAPMRCALMAALAVTSKQSMLCAIPLCLLLRFSSKQWLLFAGTAVFMLGPFALWDYRAFRYSLVGYHSSLPPRADALTPMNFLWRHWAIRPRSTPGFLLAGTSVLAAVWRLPRSPRAFTLASLCAFTLFFVFNKWMFLNYYLFLTLGAALAAATTLEADTHAPS